MFQLPDLNQMAATAETIGTALQQIRDAVKLQNCLSALLLADKLFGTTDQEVKYARACIRLALGETYENVPVGETPQDAP